MSGKLYQKNTLELKEWSEAIELQAEWESRENGFTPDFEHYFGKIAHDMSIAAATSAWSTINNHFIGEGTEQIDDFKKKSSEASKLIRTKISELISD